MVTTLQTTPSPSRAPPLFWTSRQVAGTPPTWVTQLVSYSVPHERRRMGVACQRERCVNRSPTCLLIPMTRLTNQLVQGRPLNYWNRDSWRRYIHYIVLYIEYVNVMPEYIVHVCTCSCDVCLYWATCIATSKYNNTCTRLHVHVDGSFMLNFVFSTGQPYCIV